METIKDILSGNKHNGSRGLSGEGSHLSGHRDNLAPNTNTEQNTTSSGYGSSTSGAFPDDSNIVPTGAGNNDSYPVTTDSTYKTGHDSTDIAGASSSTDYGSSSADPVSSGARHSSGSTVKHVSSVGTDRGSSMTNPASSVTGLVASNATDPSSDNTGHSGPHKTEAANRLDPAVNSSSALGLEDAHHHSTAHGGGSEEADRHHSNHVGLDTTAGAGAGLANHEQPKHEQERETKLGSATESTGLSRSTEVYGNTSDVGHQPPHLGRDAVVGMGVVGVDQPQHQSETKSETRGTIPSAGSKNYAPSSTEKQSSHLESDVTGLGGESSSIENERKGHQKDHSSVTDPANPHHSHLANVLDPRVDPDFDGSRGHTSDPYLHEHELKVEKREHKKAEHEAKREHKHELKEERHEHKESKGGLLSFLHRDKNKHHEDHKSTSGIDGASDKPFSAIPSNNGISTDSGAHNALADNNTLSTSSGPHLKTDAAGVGEARTINEHDREPSSEASALHATPLYQKPKGTDLGDKLHGVERYRGVAGPTGFPHSENESTTTGTHPTIQQTQLGHETAVIGTTGLTGEHSTETSQEAHNFPTIDQTSGQDPKYSSIAYDSSNTGFQTETKSDRNRLHKSPPANHPAAQNS